MPKVHCYLFHKMQCTSGILEAFVNCCVGGGNKLTCDLLLKMQNNTKLLIKHKSQSQKKNLVALIGHSIKLSGLWKGDNGRGIHWTARIGTFGFLGCIILILINLYQNRGDSETVFEALSVFTFCAMGALKLNSLRRNSDRWRSLLSQLEALEEQQQQNTGVDPAEYETDEEEKEFSFSDYIQKYTDRFRSTASLLNKIYYATVVIFITSPYIEYGIWKLRGYEPGYPHILPEWAPLDNISIFGYIGSTIVFQVIACLYCVIIHTTFDLTSVGVMILICGQFTLLRDYSERIGGRGKQYNLSKRRDDRARFRIQKCHKIYNILIKSISDLEEIIKNILGVYFLVATLTVCSIALRLNTEELTAMQLITLIQYMAGITTQLFLFCYYGDVMLHESTVEMGEGPFGAAIWCLSPRVRRDLHLISIAMSRTNRLRAGPFNSLNLPSFIMILRAAYSYYAVIHN